MDAKVQGPVDRVRLAVVRPFALGPFTVAPALRRVDGAGLAETLEPRVMQVLVALAHPRGAVVSRDELVERCWDGRIVGDNAINRAISRLRRLAAATDPPAFAIETIARVGYRLTARAASPPDHPQGEAPSAAPPRRAVLAGVAAAVAGVVGLGWRFTDRSAAPAAQAFYQHGLEAQRQRTFDGAREALALFRRATELDPDHAAAWGALALAHRNTMDATGEAELETVAAASRSAARRALALDPDDADALVALALVRPAFRRWAAQEADCRALLRRFPDRPAPAAALAKLLCDVGRWRDAAAVLRRLAAGNAFLPMERASSALCLWNLHRVGEADRELDEAARFWPAHPAVWIARFNILAFTGREEAAIAFVTAGGPAAWPKLPPMPPELCLLAARALAGRTRADAGRATDAIMAAWRVRWVASMQAAAHLAALGALDAAFEVVDGYFFGRRTTDGARSGAPGPFTERFTDVLFWRAAEPLRRDPRFAPLARSLGLADYWRTTGTRPDV